MPTETKEKNAYQVPQIKWNERRTKLTRATTIALNRAKEVMRGNEKSTSIAEEALLNLHQHLLQKFRTETDASFSQASLKTRIELNLSVGVLSKHTVPIDIEISFDEDAIELKLTSHNLTEEVVEAFPELQILTEPLLITRFDSLKGQYEDHYLFDIKDISNPWLQKTEPHYQKTLQRILDALLQEALVFEDTSSAQMHIIQDTFQEPFEGRDWKNRDPDLLWTLFESTAGLKAGEPPYAVDVYDVEVLNIPIIGDYNPLNQLMRPDAIDITDRTGGDTNFKRVFEQQVSLAEYIEKQVGNTVFEKAKAGTLSDSDNVSFSIFLPLGDRHILKRLKQDVSIMQATNKEDHHKRIICIHIPHHPKLGRQLSVSLQFDGNVLVSATKFELNRSKVDAATPLTMLANSEELALASEICAQLSTPTHSTSPSVGLNNHILEGDVEKPYYILHDGTIGTQAYLTPRVIDEYLASDDPEKQAVARLLLANTASDLDSMMLKTWAEVYQKDSFNITRLAQGKKKTKAE